MRKGDGVFYSTGSAVVRARVERMHRDGDMTVKALFYQDREGRDTPGYLGFNCRLRDQRCPTSRKRS